MFSYVGVGCPKQIPPALLFSPTPQGGEWRNIAMTFTTHTSSHSTRFLQFHTKGEEEEEEEG